MSTVIDTSDVASESARQYDDFIDQRLERTSFHLKTMDVANGFMLLGLFVLGSLLALVLVDHWIWDLNVPARYAAMLVVPGVSLYIAIRYVLLSLTRSINPEYAALTVEHAHPELKNGLINLLFFRDRPNSLRQGVIQGMRQQAATDLTQVPIDGAVDRSSLIKLGYVLVALTAVWVAYILLSPKNSFQTMQRVLLPWRDIARPSQVEILEVSPGDVEVYRGQTVEVRAKILGLKTDDDPVVVFSTLDGQFVDQRIPLVGDGAADRYSGTLTVGSAGVQQDLEYHIQAGDAVSRRHAVHVLQLPHVQVQRVQFDYPDYTGLTDEVVQGDGEIHAIEGTRVTVYGTANQEVQSGQIVLLPTEASAKPRRAALKVDPGDRTNVEFSFPLRMNATRNQSLYRAYYLEFSSVAGKASVDSIEYAIQVVPDDRPVVEILDPDQRTIEVPENGSQKIEVRALDPDFQLTRVQLAMRTRGRNLVRESLLETTRPSQWHTGQFTADYRFVPRDFKLKEGDVVEYLAVAEDNRHALNQSKLDPNRTISARQFLRIVKADPFAEHTNPESGADGSRSDDPKPEDAQDAGDENSQSQPNQQGQQAAGEKQSGEKQSGQNDQSQDATADDQTGENEGQDSGQKQGEQSGLQQDSEGGSDAEEQDGGGGKPGPSSDSESEATSEGQAGGDPSAESSTEQVKDPQDSDPSQQTDTENPQGDPQDSGGSSREQQSSDEAQNDEPLPSSGERDGEVVERIQQYLKEKGELEEFKKQQEAASQDSSRSRSGRSSDATEDRSQNGRDPSSADAAADESSNASGQTKGSQADSGEPNSGERNPEEKHSTGASSNDPADEENSENEASDDQRGTGSQQRGTEGSDSGNQDPSGTKGSGEKGSKGSDSAGSDSSSADDTGHEQERSGDGQTGSRDALEDPSNAANRTDDENTQSDASQRKGEDSSGDSDASDASDAQGISQQGDSEQGDSGSQKQDSSGTPETEGLSSPSRSENGAKPNDTSNDKSKDKPSGKSNDTKAKDSTQESQAGDTEGSGRKSSPNSSADSKPGTPQNPSQSGRASQGEGVAESDAAAGDDANLEYARKATDLVLEYLRDQKQQTDPELLDKLGWNQDDVDRFLRRWDEMKRNEAGSETDQGKTKLDEILKGMGLQSPNAQTRRMTDKTDTQRDNRNTGRQRNVPADLLDPFRAFQRGLQRP